MRLVFAVCQHQVIMATNKIESLDPALIRPGRIDRKIEFPLPDIKTKRRIFGIHTVRDARSPQRKRENGGSRQNVLKREQRPIDRREPLVFVRGEQTCSSGEGDEKFGFGEKNLGVKVKVAGEVFIWIVGSQASCPRFTFCRKLFIPPNVPAHDVGAIVVV